MAYITFQPSDYFNTLLYTGNNSSNAITGVGFQPDWTWIKNRTSANSNHLFDAPRGVTKRISSDSTAAEATTSNSLTSFDSDGFTINNFGDVNANNDNFVSWNWKGGTTSGISGGDITPSSYSFSTVSGFSVVKYQGNGSSGATVAHGLGATPKMVMCKGLGDTYGWKVWHTDLASGKTLNLHGNNAEDNDSNYISGASSTTFTTTGTYSVNESGSNYVAYCFAEKAGFSSIGKYIGTGSATSCPFIYTGFKPAFVVVKLISGADNWMAFTNKIGSSTDSTSGFNIRNRLLELNGSGAEQSAGSGHGLDFYANGFKVIEDNVNMNGSGSTYIYFAFAEEPLVSSNGVPAIAE